MWGNGENGLCLPADNMMNDVTQNTDMIIHIGADLETTPWGFAGQFPTNVLYFWSKLGKKQVFVSPDLNYSGAVHADKWIPILPNTDAALHLAIAYTWMTEGTYDKDYVATHVVGFDKFEDYVLGREDGVPKTPEWASEKMRRPRMDHQGARPGMGQADHHGHALLRRLVRARPVLARAGAAGGLPARHAGPGQAGRASVLQDGRRRPLDERHARRPPSSFPTCASRPKERKQARACSSRARASCWPSSKQIIPKTQLYQAILKGRAGARAAPCSSRRSKTSSSKYDYPIPKEEGGTEIHMIWMDNPCRTTCWNDGFKTVEAFRSPKIETIVVQHLWLENDTILADIILPINTKLEEEDIGGCRPAAARCTAPSSRTRPSSRSANR